MEIFVTVGWRQEGFDGIREVSWWTSEFWKKKHGDGISAKEKASGPWKKVGKEPRVSMA